MLQQQMTGASVRGTAFVKRVDDNKHAADKRDTLERFQNQPFPLRGDVLRVSEIALLSEHLREGISEGRVPVREIMCDGAEDTLGMTIPLEGAIEAEETAETTELSKVSCCGMGYG